MSVNVLGRRYGEIWPCERHADSKGLLPTKLTKLRVAHYLAGLTPEHRARVEARLRGLEIDLDAEFVCTPQTLFADEPTRPISPAVMCDARLKHEKGQAEFHAPLVVGRVRALLPPAEDMSLFPEGYAPEEIEP